MHPPPSRAEIILVGGGHAHVVVLRSFAMRPLSGARLTVVLDRPDALYSGLVPAFVAGEISKAQLSIDLVPLAARAGASVILAAATRIDPHARQVHLHGRPPLPYDACSLDVGAGVAGAEAPGVSEFALATRPIVRFVDQVDQRLRALTAGGPAPRVVIVGAGAAGIELAFTLRARTLRLGWNARISLLDGATTPPLASHPPALARAVRAAAAERGIELLSGVASAVEADAVVLQGGTRLPAELVLWVTGAGPPRVIVESALPKDGAGFVSVDTTLRVVGTTGLFAAGDCAAFVPRPLGKAGVYAVRQGPILAENLRAAVGGGALAPYRPQRDHLALLDLGNGEAIATKWGRVLRGKSALTWKRRIDFAFMERFSVLDAEGRPTAAFPPMDGGDAMLCAGCGGKVGPAVLAGALRRLPRPPADPSVLWGLETRDDAAAITTPGGDLLVTSVDSFESFLDDPFVVGEIAAVHAASDLFAKGVQPTHALVTLGVPGGPDAQVENTVFQALSGARQRLDALGVTLLGGHTLRSERLTIGLTVTGFARADQPPIPLAGARVGHGLVLTKALGTGVLLRAHGLARARGVDLEAALASMRADNAVAGRLASALASAATDVSGFGLSGHLLTMLRASGVGATLDLDALPALPGATVLLEQGLRSTLHPANEGATIEAFDLRPGAATHRHFPLLFDPQTSGGLLLATADPTALVAALHGAGVSAAIVGVIVAGVGIAC